MVFNMAMVMIDVIHKLLWLLKWLLYGYYSNNCYYRWLLLTMLLWLWIIIWLLYGN